MRETKWVAFLITPGETVGYSFMPITLCHGGSADPNHNDPWSSTANPNPWSRWPPEIIHAADAWLHGDFDRSAVHVLETCFAGEVTMVQSMTNGVLTEGIQAAQSVPWQAFSVLTLVISMLLMFMGWQLGYLVRAYGGLYIGASVSVFLLTFDAWDLIMGDCLMMLVFVTVCSLLSAIICWRFRKSMYIANMSARPPASSYHLCLEPNGFGSNTLYISIGFFAAMGAYFVAMVGDLAWMICTALMGSYFATTALVELVVVPYVPDGYNYAAFLAYRPSPNMSGLHKDVHNFAMSKYLWLPLGAMLLLTLVGLLIQLACYNLWKHMQAQTLN